MSDLPDEVANTLAAAVGALEALQDAAGRAGCAALLMESVMALAAIADAADFDAASVNEAAP